MDKYIQMEKNTVSSKGQLKESACVQFANPEGTGVRVMFVGNSITLHGVRPEVGWFHCWGMAASTKDKDYVHCLMRAIKEKDSDAAFCICQVAGWERNYREGEKILDIYEQAREFEADIIVMRFVENCPKDDSDSDVFKNKLDTLLAFLNKTGKAKIILTTGFWHHPKDAAILEYSEEKRLPCILLGDLGERDEMKAIGLFEHNGVANHPGDLGMQHIAERIYGEIERILG